jgi:hypothetical protein
MLLGRAAEQEQLGELLESARAERGAALALSGEAGIGKTPLLDDARSRAVGMLVLAARGLESESSLPYAGLSQLLAPIVGLRRELPLPRRAALESALALGPPRPGDRFATYAAALGVLGEAAERSPLLVLADDAPWLDPASLEALRFCARRLSHDRIAMLFVLPRGRSLRLRRAGNGAVAHPMPIACGEPDRGLDLFALAATLVEAADLSAVAFVAVGTAETQVWVGEHTRAAQLLSRLIARARVEGAISALPYALATLSEALFRSGDWVGTYAAATESVALAVPGGDTAELANSLCAWPASRPDRGARRSAGATLRTHSASVRNSMFRRLAPLRGTFSVTSSWGWGTATLRWRSSSRRHEQRGGKGSRSPAWPCGLRTSRRPTRVWGGSRRRMRPSRCSIARPGEPGVAWRTPVLPVVAD